MRQAFPDGSVWVRTQPIGYLDDHRSAFHEHAWHQLTYALSGHLEVETPAMRAVVPSDRAVMIPAGLSHRETMRAPVAVRTLYLAPGAFSPASAAAVTLAVSPLLRELIAYAAPCGALDHEVPHHAHLTGLLCDLIRQAPEVSLQLPMPHSPAARRVADLIQADPSGRRTLSTLTRQAGASLRTVERLFVSETGLTIGQWRRRFRLLTSVRMLASGMAVTRVAQETGYATPSGFCAAFKQLFGHSPRATPGRYAASG